MTGVPNWGGVFGPSGCNLLHNLSSPELGCRWSLLHHWLESTGFRMIHGVFGNECHWSTILFISHFSHALAGWNGHLLSTSLPIGLSWENSTHALPARPPGAPWLGQDSTGQSWCGATPAVVRGAKWTLPAILLRTPQGWWPGSAITAGCEELRWRQPCFACTPVSLSQVGMRAVPVGPDILSESLVKVGWWWGGKWLPEGPVVGMRGVRPSS